MSSKEIPADFDEMANTLAMGNMEMKERISALLRKAFKAGFEEGYDQGCYEACFHVEANDFP